MVPVVSYLTVWFHISAWWHCVFRHHL